METESGRSPLPPDACADQPDDIVLIVVQPWDIYGADQADRRTEWLKRSTMTYPRYFAARDFTVRTLSEVTNLLADVRGDRAHED
ncbi:hypothetical protein RCH23_002757 [Cryobacterium sp. CAN_C3]|uniref:hypothetical protein n=1 Tax=unclassified Cryobacterium TaxID=2649013 RepID=UPI0018CB99E1|nr:hypothetical protein [Cryobacterium sp. CAN_C3]MEC5155361.1 hypothetical protein [Cryobacterium sp. CAN_C3]